MPQPPWTNPSGVRVVVDQWQASGAVKRCFAAERSLPPASPEYGAIPQSLPERLKAALSGRGIAQLYSHQVQAIEAARQGRHVVIATPTASGKSLCFHLPVLAALAEDPTATALFVYPTKALSRDQEHNLRELMNDSATRGAPCASVAASCSPIRTCCTPAFCPTTRAGRRSFKA